MFGEFSESKNTSGDQIIKEYKWFGEFDESDVIRPIEKQREKNEYFGSKDLKKILDLTLTDVNIEENFDMPLKERIIEQIAKRPAIVLKSQQRYEPDLTTDERKQITEELLSNCPTQFLYRFGKYLKREHLQYFDSISDDEDMKSYLLEAQKALNESTKRLKIRNRRFGALRRMQLSGASYFKEEEMRKRDPLLYEELVDRNLTNEERAEKRRENSPVPINTFSGFLLEQLDRNEVTDKLKHQLMQEEECYEEESEEEEEELVEEIVVSRDDITPIDEREKNLMMDEFKTTLHLQFISGKDLEFDYSNIDDSEENDLLEWESQDLEERYFDDEDPQILPVETDSNILTNKS